MLRICMKRLLKSENPVYSVIKLIKLMNKGEELDKANVCIG